MKKVVVNILRSLPRLGDVLSLSLFLFVVFAIFGLQLFSGSLRQYCATPDGQFPESRDDWIQCSRNPYGKQCDANSDYPVCHKGNHIRDNPNGGMTNFDNFGYALLTIYQVISKEGWTDVMYAVGVQLMFHFAACIQV